MDKFYSYYKIPIEARRPYDSVYNLIEQRRSAFSTEYRMYKEKNNSLDGFSYDWTTNENKTLSSLNKKLPQSLKHLIYYSYFDLAYGGYGLKLNSQITKKALKEIEPASSVWAMEPSLLESVIKSAGGEDVNAHFINRILKSNNDKNLTAYIKNNLSPDRALKNGKFLPVFQYKNLSDTTRVVSTETLRDKYYLIDIWATWCKPCIDEFPLLVKEYDELKDKNIGFVSISIDDNATAAINFLQTKFNLPWQKGIAVTRKEVMNALMINGIPCTILISPEGKILSYGNDLRGSNLKKTLNEKMK